MQKAVFVKKSLAARYISCFLFLSILFIGLVWVNAAVRPNEDRDGIWKTYKKLEPNSIDVLLTGSSKIHANINPVVMWKSQGFTSYDLSGSSMDLTTMYYYLREAFKTQHPKVVVIDMLLVGNGYSELSDIQTRNIMNMPFGRNKLAASMSPFIQANQRERIAIPFETFHSRVLNAGQVSGASMLNRLFKSESPNVFMGYRYLDTAQNISPNHDIQNFDPSRFNQRYAELKKSLDFLKSQNCEILLVNTPSDRLNYLTEYENELVKRISREYRRVSYFWPRDYKKDFKIDYGTEMLDNTHLNSKGAHKFSLYFAKYLKSHFETQLKTSCASQNTFRAFALDYSKYALMSF